MKYIYRGRFSKGLDCMTAMGVTFNGREPSEVTDAPAICWFEGHPDYVRVPDEPVVNESRAIMAAALAKKTPPDIDGDGKPGGSPKGLMATAAVGARKKRVAKAKAAKAK